MAVKIETIVGDVTGLHIKYTSSCSGDRRFSTEGKIASQYCKISKNSGEGFHQPHHGGGMNLHARPRVNAII